MDVKSAARGTCKFIFYGIPLLQSPTYGEGSVPGEWVMSTILLISQGAGQRSVDWLIFWMHSKLILVNHPADDKVLGHKTEGAAVETGVKVVAQDEIAVPSNLQGRHVVTEREAHREHAGVP